MCGVSFVLLNPICRGKKRPGVVAAVQGAPEHRSQLSMITIVTRSVVIYRRNVIRGVTTLG